MTVREIVRCSFATLRKFEFNFGIREECLEDTSSKYARKILNQRTGGRTHVIIKKEYLQVLKDIMDLYEASDLRWEESIEELRAFLLTIDKKFPRDIFELIYSFTWDSPRIYAPVCPLVKQWPKPVSFRSKYFSTCHPPPQ